MPKGKPTGFQMLADEVLQFFRRIRGHDAVIRAFKVLDDLNFSTRGWGFRFFAHLVFVIRELSKVNSNWSTTQKRAACDALLDSFGDNV
jgi:hypothetical protein